MTVGAALLGYALLLGGLGQLAYRQDGWLARAPRLGATVLLAAAWSVVLALFLAGLTLALPATALSSGLSDLIGACILRLRTAYVTPGGAAMAGAGLTLSTTIALRGAWALMTVSRVRRGERRRQKTLMSLHGTRDTELGAVVLNEPQPTAYCVAGRAKTVVVTSGAIELLTKSQLAAVLAHEHAHGTAGHHRALGIAALAGRTLPELPLLRKLVPQVRDLLELHADETAAQDHHPESLATALVAMATARQLSVADHATTALAAAGSNTAARVRRLLGPPVTSTRRRRRVLRTVVVALGVAPLLVALAPAGVAATEPPVRTSTVAVELTTPPVALGR